MQQPGRRRTNIPTSETLFDATEGRRADPPSGICRASLVMPPLQLLLQRLLLLLQRLLLLLRWLLLLLLLLLCSQMKGPLFVLANILCPSAAALAVVVAAAVGDASLLYPCRPGGKSPQAVRTPHALQAAFGPREEPQLLHFCSPLSLHLQGRCRSFRGPPLWGPHLWRPPAYCCHRSPGG